MNQTQQNILWLGIMIVLFFLFTNKTFRDKLFNRGTQATSANTKLPFTLTSVISIPSNKGVPVTAV